MSESTHLSDAIERFYTSPHNGWFASTTSAIQGLTAEQAAKVPAEGFNCVWAVLEHMRYWMEYMLLRLQGVVVDRASFMEGVEDWSAMPNPPSEVAWQAEQRWAAEALQKFTETVAHLSEEELNAEVNPGKPKRWQIIQGVLAHNAYHTCEIITIRHMQGLWLEDV